MVRVTTFTVFKRECTALTTQGSTALGRSFLLMTAFVSLACASRLAPPDGPEMMRSVPERAPATRLATLQDENEGYAWSSTYGNPRPKLTETMSLGTSDLPGHSSSSDFTPSVTTPSVTTPSVTTEVTNSVVVVVAPSPYDTRWRRAPNTKSEAPLPKKVSQRPSRTAGAPSGQEKPLLRSPVDVGKSETKRTSIVAPATPRQ